MSPPDSLPFTRFIIRGAMPSTSYLEFDVEDLFVVNELVHGHQEKLLGLAPSAGLMVIESSPVLILIEYLERSYP